MWRRPFKDKIAVALFIGESINTVCEALENNSPPALIAAIESNLVEMFSLNRNWDQAEVHNGKDLFWTISNIPFPLFNSVLRAQLEQNDIDGSIERIIAHYKSKNAPILWWTGPSTQPSNLETHLKNHNFNYQGDSIGMAVDLLALEENTQPVPDLSIQTVYDEVTMRTWCNVLKDGFALPEYVGYAFFDLFSSIGLKGQSTIRHYIGLLKGDPIAVSTLFLCRGVAGIYNVATVPRARRKGVGTSITLKPLQEARKMGYQIGVLQSLEMGVGVYSKLGFQRYCNFSRYLWTTDTLRRPT